MAKIKILVAEDESLVAKDIGNMLRSLGYDVLSVVATGEEAVALAEKGSPDLVLMDIVLRGEMDGIQAAERIWESLLIPVIYLTAYADERTLQRAKVTEPFGYILKPFDQRELQTTIEMAFYKAQMDKKHRDREDWLATVLGSIGDGVIAVDESDRVTYLNAPAEKLSGWKPSEALHRPLKAIFSGDGGDGLTGEAADPLALAETILKTKSGPPIPIELSIAPIRGPKNSLRGRVLIFRDITHRKRAEEELKKSSARLERALDGTVQAMAMTIEMRDPYTAGHQRRVSRLSCAIALAIGMPRTRIEGLRVAGEIHDIGKIYVPAEILSKPAPLTEIETSIIRTHPQVGFDILKNVDFPWPIARIISQHHERLDGSGYPKGLDGPQILPEARIIAVADIIEAMSSHRPYRPSYGVERALAEIEAQAGRILDAEIVDVCLRLFRENKFSFD